MAAATGEPAAATSPQLLSVAPMMDWTDLHYRQLARLISRHTWLYTEMVVDSTLLHNPDHDRFLWHPPEQRPLVCQLGGSDPGRLAAAARIVESYGYDEINLNVGCPSDRVAGAGCFGAALMLDAELVAACCSAMSAAVQIPITVKCRLGVDDKDSYDNLVRFVHTVSTQSPVRHFIIHARKAHLKGLNPHQNRTIPPLRYGWVWALKRDFPELTFSLNGGVQGLDAVGAALRVPGSPLEGVMVGRAAYHAPWDVLASADVRVFGATTNAATSRRQVLDAYAEYCAGVQTRYANGNAGPDGGKSVVESGADRTSALAKKKTATAQWKGPSLRTLFKPLLGMFAGEPRGRQWRAAVDVAFKAGNGSVREILDATLDVLLPEMLDAPPRAHDPEADAARLAAMDATELQQVLTHWDPDFPQTPDWFVGMRQQGVVVAEGSVTQGERGGHDDAVAGSTTSLENQAAETGSKKMLGSLQEAALRDAVCSPAAEENEADEAAAVAEAPTGVLADKESMGDACVESHSNATVDAAEGDGGAPPPCKKPREEAETEPQGPPEEDWVMVEGATRTAAG